MSFVQKTRERRISSRKAFSNFSIFRPLSEPSRGLFACTASRLAPGRRWPRRFRLLDLPPPLKARFLFFIFYEPKKKYSCSWFSPFLKEFTHLNGENHEYKRFFFESYFLHVVQTKQSDVNDNGDAYDDGDVNDGGGDFRVWWWCWWWCWCRCTSCFGSCSCPRTTAAIVLIIQEPLLR